MAVTVSHFEFGLFSTFLMHYNNLEQGCNLVGEYLHMECFHMECSLTTGFRSLAAAAILSCAVPKFALYVCRSALEDKANPGKLGSEETRLTDSCSDDTDEDSVLEK